MKVVAINGSPHGDTGNTALILNPFLEGMKAAGAKVMVFETLGIVSRPLLPRDQYVAIANQHIAQRVQRAARTGTD